MTSPRNGVAATESGPAEGLSGAAWVKSSRSGPTGGNCVEVALLHGRRVAVRDSRLTAGPVLVFTAGEWDAFIGGAKDGEFG